MDADDARSDKRRLLHLQESIDQGKSAESTQADLG